MRKNKRHYMLSLSHLILLKVLKLNFVHIASIPKEYPITVERNWLYYHQCL